MRLASGDPRYSLNLSKEKVKDLVIELLIADDYKITKEFSGKNKIVNKIKSCVCVFET